MSTPNQAWRFFSRLCTCFIPNRGLFWVGKTDEKKQAWREKVALCFIMLAANAGFLGFGGLIHMLSCGDGSTPAGTCGNGDRGDGTCSDGSCCSEVRKALCAVFYGDTSSSYQSKTKICHFVHYIARVVWKFSRAL